MGHLRLGDCGKAPQDFKKFSMFELLAINQKSDKTFSEQEFESIL